MSAVPRETPAHVERVITEVLAGQGTAGARMSAECVELLVRQVRGEITVDEAVAVIAARARRYAAGTR